MTINLGKRQNFGSRFGEAVGAGIASGAQAGLEERSAKKLMGEKQGQVGDYLESLGVENARNLPLETQNKLVEQYSKYAAREGMLKKLGFGNEFGNEQNKSQRQQSTDMNRPDQMNDQGEIEVGNVAIDTAPKKISQERINAAAVVEPSLAREWREGNKAIDREEARKQNLQIKERQFFHRESSKYDDNLMSEAKSAEKKNRSIHLQAIVSDLQAVLMYSHQILVQFLILEYQSMVLQFLWK